ncbi:hypothetical protein EV127DRAFT_19969 [Xylaria flabelliformis]|nr:hypothetical protein EV127DRAFT_19969 [Xylaria flabelliformis]
MALTRVQKRIICFTEFLILGFSAVVGFGERWNVRQQINPPKDLRSFSYFCSFISDSACDVKTNPVHLAGPQKGTDIQSYIQRNVISKHIWIMNITHLKPKANFVLTVPTHKTT